MKITNTIHAFYFYMTVHELKQLHQQPAIASITYNSMMYLDIISFKEKCTVSFLAELLHISKSAVTMKVHELERQGLITKTQSNEDRRVFYLSTNPDVLERFHAYDEFMYDTDAWVRENFSPEEVESFCKILTGISARYKKGVKYE